MAIRFDEKVVACELFQSSAEAEKNTVVAAPAEKTAEIIQMHEKLERPEMLLGSTYKIKTPLSEHALYVTVNDILLNPGTVHEHRRPFEIFINSKNMDHFQWIVALTRIISAVFRKGGDVTFMIDELKSVFDPKGGYFKKGGRYMPSLVAEMGDVIEAHMKLIGMIPPGLDEHQQRHIETKRKEYQQRNKQASSIHHDNADFPKEAILCNKCSVKAVISMDNCLTCLACGDSRCN